MVAEDCGRAAAKGEAMKTLLGIGLGVVLGGCSSAPLGPAPGSEPVVSSAQEEVALNDAAATSMRLISRLYLGDYAALEWYQPVAGVIAFSVVQDARYELIDNENLRGLKPTQVFKRFAGSLEVPEALVKLEAHPEVLQELRDTVDLERFAPEADLLAPGVAIQADFSVSQGQKSFPCGWSNFYNHVCNDSAWDKTTCYSSQREYRELFADDVDESQMVLCSFYGTNQMQIQVTNCHNVYGQSEGSNICGGDPIPGTGVWYDVSNNWLRSWHGNAQTYAGFDDAYDHASYARPKAGSLYAKYQFQTRVFWD
jgi:hypothetical protein